MIVKELDLGLDYEKAGLPLPKTMANDNGFILKNYKEYCKDRKRPAVLVLPGGGYAFTSEREATPIALEFTAAGISAFVLRYTCAPDGYFPTQLIEALQAVKVIREHAEEWHIDPDKIAVCGFSAGGHLTASTGVFWNHPLVREHGLEGDMHKPNGLILSYPVITGGEKAHRGSFQNLLGDQYSDEMVAFTSLETQVTESTPKSFIWHTYEDSGVPVENSMMFASALIAHKVPVELHIYPHGEHGLSLANPLVCGPDGVIPKVQTWIGFAKEWVYDL